jgi:hypothetical protein
VYSARAYRDAAELGIDEPWLVVPTSAGSGSKTMGSFGPAAGVLLALLTCALVLILPSGSRRSMPLNAGSYTPPVSALSDRLSRAFPGRVALTENFKTGMRDWIGAAGASDDWSQVAGAIRPGRLRLWKPTLTLSDYQMDFQGQIENRAMGWAFRATDTKNFYATKITLAKASSGTRADIVHYAVLSGHEGARTQLPLPMTVKPDTLYQVRVRIKGDRFHTFVNGQLVDSWTDQRLRAGGVGFFAEQGERALIRSVNLSNQGGVLDRLLAFGFFIPPEMTAF